MDVTLWGRQAEIAKEYLTKGKPVYIEGRLQLDSWDDKQTGQKRSKLRVTGEAMQLLGSRGEGGGSGGGGGGGGSPPDPDDYDQRPARRAVFSKAGRRWRRRRRRTSKAAARTRTGRRRGRRHPVLIERQICR